MFRSMLALLLFVADYLQYLKTKAETTNLAGTSWKKSKYIYKVMCIIQMNL